jgi:hypothetical protein
LRRRVCGWKRRGVRLVNEVNFGPGDINSVAISCSSGKLVFMKAGDGGISFKEYLSSGNERYYVRTSTGGGELSIGTSRRPVIPYLNARLAVFIHC